LYINFNCVIGQITETIKFADYVTISNKFDCSALTGLSSLWDMFDVVGFLMKTTGLLGLFARIEAPMQKVE
jgi:hypothetical protein